ncbi:unnamed protein product [Amoebophrya sp. A25]|nr:unnamed protein product [Amoebophrya sp. A25]|eukprot:GSA25T00027140001.1
MMQSVRRGSNRAGLSRSFPFSIGGSQSLLAAHGNSPLLRLASRDTNVNQRGFFLLGHAGFSTSAADVYSATGDSIRHYDTSSGLQLNPNYRRPSQAGAVAWFLQIASEVAPEFEFYVLPKHSRYPLLVRQRIPAFRPPFEGLWSLLQIRSTRRLSEYVCKDGRVSSLWYTTRNIQYRLAPEVPNLVMSSGTSSCFVFSGEDLKASLYSKPGSSNEIDLVRSPHLLGTWLRSVYLDRPVDTISASLEDLTLRATTTSASVTQRWLLVQMMRLPVLQNLTFPAEIGCGVTTYNATLCGRRMLFRVPENSSSRVSIDDPKVRLRYEFGGRRGCRPLSTDDDVDYMILLVCSRSESTKLTGVGILPYALLDRNHLLCSDTNTVTKRKPVLVVDGQHNISGDFKGFDQYFYFFSEIDSVVKDEKHKSSFVRYVKKIFSVWDDGVQSKTHVTTL